MFLCILLSDLFFNNQIYFFTVGEVLTYQTMEVDIDDAEYKDRVKTNRAWEEIYLILKPNFVDLSESDKKKFGKLKELVLLE